MEGNDLFVAIESPAHRIPAAPLVSLKNDLLSGLRFAHTEHNGAGAEQSIIHPAPGWERSRNLATMFEDFLFGVIAIPAFTLSIGALCHGLFALMPL